MLIVVALEVSSKLGVVKMPTSFLLIRTDGGGKLEVLEEDREHRNYGPG